MYSSPVPRDGHLPPHLPSMQGLHKHAAQVPSYMLIARGAGGAISCLCPVGVAVVGPKSSTAQGTVDTVVRKMESELLFYLIDGTCGPSFISLSASVSTTFLVPHESRDSVGPSNPLACEKRNHNIAPWTHSAVSQPHLSPRRRDHHSMSRKFLVVQQYVADRPREGTSVTCASRCRHSNTYS